MKRILVFLLTIFVFYCSSGQVKDAVNLLEIDNGITQEQVDLIFEKAKVFPNDTEISMAFLKNDTVYFYGVKRHNDTLGNYENSKAIFEIGSITKVFTSTLLARFVVNNELSLNDSIQEFFDFDITTEGPITLEQLSNHTSGLPRLPTNFEGFINPQNPYKNYDATRLETYLAKKIRLDNRPGTKSEYSNLGAGLLGYILTKKSKISYEELLQKYIFTRYSMLNSTTKRQSIKDSLITGLDAYGSKTSNWDFDVLVGAGGIFSNVAGLSKFAQAQFDDTYEELKLTRQKTFTVNDYMDMGLGWHLIKAKSGANYVWHNGGTGGYSSSMALDIENKIGLIILSNVSAFNSKSGAIDGLCFGLLKNME